MSELLVFLGDIKGTKDALSSFETHGRVVLERRIENRQDCFGESFRQFHQRSRSLIGITFSDSVVAYWSDVVEGKRFAVEFMTTVWRSLDRSIVRFRGFLDASECIDENSLVTHVLTATTERRFVKVLPAGLAAWSVAAAEASHFPDGLFVSRRLSTQLGNAEFEPAVLTAGPFEYLQLKIPYDAG